MFSGDDAHRFQKLVAATGSVRFGLDAFGFCTLARGRADLVVEACLKPYDFMAPGLIVAEAGGLMTDWRGNPLGLSSEGKVIAAGSAQLHASALGILA